LNIISTIHVLSSTLNICIATKLQPLTRGNSTLEFLTNC